MSPQQCMVCNEAKSKYKCPTCVVPYCSLVCFKKHKETPCAKPKPVGSDEEPKDSSAIVVSGDEEPIASCATHVPGDEKPIIPEPLAQGPVYVNEECEVLEKSQLESIAASSEIRDALKDEDLRNLIRKIDCSSNPNEELDKAMDLDFFRIFSEKVLSAANS